MDLEILDDDAHAWFDGQLRRDPRLHLIMGDSVARRASFRANVLGDRLLNLATGGATWRTLSQRLRSDLDEWSAAAAASGRARGYILIWLSGNDAYSRVSGLANKDLEHMQAVQNNVRNVLRGIREGGFTEEVVILGPIPRPAADLIGGTWESTGAYHLERALLKLQQGDNFKLVKLGRALTIKISKKRSGIGHKCLPWYAPDRVHLSAAGYKKLAPHLPAWLGM